VLEHAEGWRISSQPTKVESNRQHQRSPETASDQNSPAASRQSHPASVGLGLEGFSSLVDAAAGSQSHIQAAMNASTISTWC